MKTLQHLTYEDRNWLIKWAVYPAFAYYASWLLGLFVLMIPVFVLLLIVIQMKRIERLTNSNRAGYWVLSLAGYFALAWLTKLVSTPDSVWLNTQGVAKLALIYYGTQALSEVALAQVAPVWRWGWFALANLGAACLWVGAYVLVGWVAPLFVTPNVIPGLWMVISIPILGVMSNILTGLGLLMATKPAAQPTPTPQHTFSYYPDLG
jgi:hypothetical protein